MEREDFNKRDLLFDYQQYPASKSCYLDGRYFNIVFGDYPGLIENPLYVHLDEDNAMEIYLPHIKIVPSEDYFGLLRVIVTSDKIRHSLIVVFDYENEKAYIYNPDVHHPELNDMLVDNISLYLSKFFDYEYFEVPQIEYMEKEQLICKKTGVCNALIIMYALYFIEGLEFTNKNVQNVRKFMNAIEANYVLPEGAPDIEYVTGAQAIGLGTGIAGGAILGSAFGPGGAILGAGLGGLAGYSLGTAVSPRYDNYGYDYGYPYYHGYGRSYGYGYPYRHGYGYGYRRPYGYYY